MHDPMVVAFDIPRPWPRPTPGGENAPRWRFTGRFWQVAGRRYYWPSLITVWHVEPVGHDSGEVCKHHTRVQDADGKWSYKFHHGWKAHVHHWKIQVHPLQAFRRWALTRCQWCSGRSVKGDRVDCTNGWDRPRGHWWQGEPGLFHSRCQLVATAKTGCVCDEPLPEGHSGVGTCQLCGLRYFWQSHEPWKVEQRRILHAVPEGQAPSAEVYEAACAVYEQHQAAAR